MNEDLRHCPSCKLDKPLSEFAKNRNKKDGVASWCKLCTSVSVKKWFSNPENRDSHKKRTTARRQEYKDKLVEYFGSKCFDCKQSFPACCYDFHHLDPSEKDFDLGSKGSYNWDNLLREAEKCVMLCSNCHRIRHHER